MGSVEPRIIPCLLLDGDALVKTVQFADPTYVGDPVNVLSIFNEFEVDEIVLLDIAAPTCGAPTSVERLTRLAEECFIPLAYGGGLRSCEQMAQVLRAGVEKVILNTLLWDDADQVREAARLFGSQAVVASIDVRQVDGQPRVFVSGGTIDTGETPVGWARRAEDLGVGEVLLTSIDREGSMDGFDLELIESVAEVLSVPLIAHGGAGKWSQLSGPLRDGGASAVAAGSLFVYQGSSRGVLINYPPRAQVLRLLAR